MSDLIDTTEMYLRTIYELEEEGVVPLRARIAQRLGQSGPTVSQTVARMERAGLLVVSGDRHLELTEDGRSKATRVMRKHRLAERLLTDLIGLEWEYVHEEACRWEHVMSERVERRIVALLDHPVESPYGNPIPGLGEIGEEAEVEDFRAGLVPLTQAATTEPQEVRVRRLGEPAQTDPASMARLAHVGLRPGRSVRVHRPERGAVVVSSLDGGGSLELADEVAAHVFVINGSGASQPSHDM
ncbi:metal-dependent transcriptional regulator [Quadrisphaera sp. DSM 44207]|uniref:metal-dependent transcriptional regulator n=1 Tax=Quadrisphaera sp. DSM 44207 TaxID=1881057 RepID=UPI0008847E18|nr:metal-dependent transcriptional regulator [Quadrisphaera sp. DSM 44207]SDQ65587.1 iron (metal) dependent repressor, DtxR family [Quadrisphaera sp. DSM 44207]